MSSVGPAGLATILRRPWTACNPPFTRSPTRTGFFASHSDSKSSKWLPVAVPFTSTWKPSVFSVPVNSLPFCFNSRIDFSCSPLSSFLPSAIQRPARLCPNPGAASNAKQKNNPAALAATTRSARFPLRSFCIPFTLHSAARRRAAGRKDRTRPQIPEPPATPNRKTTQRRWRQPPAAHVSHSALFASPSRSIPPRDAAPPGARTVQGPKSRSRQQRQTEKQPSGAGGNHPQRTFPTPLFLHPLHAPFSRETPRRRAQGPYKTPPGAVLAAQRIVSDYRRCVVSPNAHLILSGTRPAP